jgi:hypothetical protein
MRVSSKIVVNIASGRVVERESVEYFGPVAECISAGLGGSGSKSSSKSKSKQQATSETGTRYNPDFMTQATNYAQDPTNAPVYNPQYVKGTYTPLAPGGFDKLENNLYDTQSSKLSQAYNTAVGQQREQLAQTGALNSPSQFLEGSARSSLDRSYMQNLQQAARDAALGRLGAQQTEAARQTAFDTGEATRQTGFNTDTAQQLMDLWLKKMQAAIEAGRYSTGQSSGSSNASSSSISGSGNAQGSFMNFGGGSS